MATQKERNQEKYNDTHKIVNDILYKKCSLHAEYFPDEDEWIICDEEHFYKTKSKGEGTVLKLHTYCKRCNIKKAYKWRSDNPESYNKSHDKYNNNQCFIPNLKVRKRKSGKIRRENGKAGKWQRDNPDKIKQYRLNREQNKTHKISKKEWDACQEYFNNQCAYCGLPIEEHYINFRGNIQLGNFHKEHVDHQGANDLSNCVPSCKVCNCSKHDFDFEEWYQKQTFCSKEKIDKIHKWMSEDYKLYIEEKIVLPYIVKKIRNDEGNIIGYELWSKDDEGEPLECLGTEDKEKDLKIYKEKLLNTLYIK